MKCSAGFKAMNAEFYIYRFIFLSDQLIIKPLITAGYEDNTCSNKVVLYNGSFQHSQQKCGGMIEDKLRFTNMETDSKK